MSAFLGPAISAAGSLLGGLFDSKSEDEALAYQKELNQNKISWTVEDAKRAGVSPLAALGSPVSSAWAVPTGQSRSGSHIADAGKALSGSIMERQMMKDQAERTGLENDLLRAQIESTRSTTYATIANSQRTAPIDVSTGRPKIPMVAEFGHYDNEGKWQFSHYGPNPEAYEIGGSEIATGAALHGSSHVIARGIATREEQIPKLQLVDDIHARGGPFRKY